MCPLMTKRAPDCLLRSPRRSKLPSRPGWITRSTACGASCSFCRALLCSPLLCRSWMHSRNVTVARRQARERAKLQEMGQRAGLSEEKRAGTQ